MEISEFITHISSQLKITFIHYQAISGGDIGLAFRLKTQDDFYFLKIYSGKIGMQMAKAEVLGLQAIAQTQTMAVPQIIASGSFENNGFIIMEYVESNAPTPSAYKRFGMQLAEMHRETESSFGFATDNFIGRLPQRNAWHKSWAEFYWKERLLPQYQQAINQGYFSSHRLPTDEKAMGVIASIFPDTLPALIHGDLWGGNFLISTKGIPYLIDPAVYYGHPAIDIGMSKLFGGFSQHFYDAYYGHRGIKPYDTAQIDLAQLYFLFVHLNLFGQGYLSSVSNLIQRYFE